MLASLDYSQFEKKYIADDKVTVCVIKYYSPIEDTPVLNIFNLSQPPTPSIGEKIFKAYSNINKIIFT